MRDGILLDTCAAIFLMTGAAMAPGTKQVMDRAGALKQVFVSPVTAWEIGLLARPGRRSAHVFLPSPQAWFATLLSFRPIAPAPFNVEIALEISALPDDIHPDPADRMLIATARVLDLALMTRDRKILAYAEAGHLRAVGC